ncbi:MAG: YdeI/OmpD-associated family protein [Rhodocyclaceae bacterium]|nr:YdeI/OmpD-associated family protein [Rhodocyclaceae bacterium]MBK9624645.1 YdeI/OmpD-associated family protein [Rhodocyclaceae bacterium]MBL0077008.1 YdeI/OmpD-associated family protein [Rhodocyclaceae bacterium]MBP6279957.1 YdeI/OmpD-associated family protein [Rhodocyclaceae bacterium]
MGSKDPRVDQFISESGAFAKPILLHLRKQVHANCPEVTETIKWSMPFFEYKGKILCHMAAFKAHCAFGFWHGKQLEIEGKQSTAMGQFGRITSLADLPTNNDIAFAIQAAMKLHDDGVKSPTRAKPAEKKDLVIPDYFLAAVKKNKKALATFDGFTPSKKREYVEWVTEAKTDVTRDKRLAQSVEWMAEGKVRNWKYLNC